MKLFQRTPLAWKNLTHRPRRLIVALAGVGFGVLLMFMETGFRNALFDSTVEIVEHLDADIIIVSRARYMLSASQTFDRSRIHLAHTCPDVEQACPLYIETYYAKWRTTGSKSYPIRVLAFDLDRPVFTFSVVADSLERLGEPQTALVDFKSKAKYGVPPPGTPINHWPAVELNDHSIRLLGGFTSGTDFANDGNLIMSAANFERYFRHRGRGPEPLKNVDVGVVQVAEGADVERVKQQLHDLLPKDVSIYAKQEFVDREIEFWDKSTPIGFVFLVGTIMGFIIGAIICYQIIYSMNAGYLREFATLKAMGYQPRYFILLVLRQSFYLSLVGFIPGVIASLLLYGLVTQATGLMMALTLKRAAIVLFLTIAMCCLSGALAMRKVLASDPAELF